MLEIITIWLIRLAVVGLFLGGIFFRDEYLRFACRGMFPFTLLYAIITQVIFA